MPTRSLAAIGLSLTFLAPPLFADDLDYAVVDDALKVVKLDTAEKESFLAVRTDPAGRLFVGGREELFVYEPDDKLGFKPRQLLCKFPKDAWVYDVEIRGHDLYVMTVTALYIIRDGVVKRDGLRPQRLVWGVPSGHVHQCFHALAWGPEGDLYFSMGDPLWYYGDFNRPDHWGHWTMFHKPEVGAKDEWAKLPYTGVGAVFRVKPDGTKLQVVATGLRNSCGLCFDRHWNLFSNDNDHEGIPAEYVPGRLNHVTPHSYFSWPRGWMPSKSPDRADLLDTMNTDLGRFVPVLQAYYDDTFMPEKYRNSLLVARWCTRAVNYYPLKPKGATFTCEEKPLLVGKNNARPVGVCVGRGGRVFVTISYMAHNEGSPVYKSDLVMVTKKDDATPYKSAIIDPTEASGEQLASELVEKDWSRRQTAHQEVLRRGQQVLRAVTDRNAMVPDDHPFWEHYVWLWGMIEGSRNPRVLPSSPNNHAGLQILRWIAEVRWPRRERVFTGILADAEVTPAERHAALLGLFDTDGLPPWNDVVTKVISDDRYLRQAATFLLAERASMADLQMLADSKEARVRLMSVLAVGHRLTVPPAAKPLAESLPLEPWRNPDEAYFIEYADGKEDLRKLGRLGMFTVAEHWKAAKHTDEQEKLFDLLLSRLKDDDESVRLQATFFLSLLNDPRSEPEVIKLRRETDERRLATAPVKLVNQAWLIGPFPDGGKGFDTVHPPETGAIDLAAQYAVGEKKLSWKESKTDRIYNLGDLYGPCDGCSFYGHVRLESAGREKAQLLVGSDDGVKVWHNGKLVWTHEVSRAALPLQDVVPLDLEPGSNDILVRIRNVTGSCGLYMHFRARGQVTARLPEKLGLETLAERLKAGGKDVAPEFFTIDWSKAVKEGDAEKGRKLFGALSCAKCHGVTADAANTGGPSLADAGKRFTVPYLVESIMLPSKQVSPVFKATEVTTTKGQVFSGLAVAEDGQKIELLLQDATRKVIARNEVESRRLLDTSPMPQGVVKTPVELRDLLAYLLSEKPLLP